MDLIIGVIAAFFLGGAAGWALRATRDPVDLADSAEPGVGQAPGGAQTRRAEDRAGTEAAGRRGAQAGERRTDRRAVRPPATRAAGAAGVTVLLADDRPELVSVHREHLERHGYRVITAGDGEAALALARAEHPAVAVLDHSMPGCSGIDVTRALKADPATADIVVLLMTAHSYGAVGASARAAGASAFMSKPCEPSRVLREVSAHAPAA